MKAVAMTDHDKGSISSGSFQADRANCSAAYASGPQAEGKMYAYYLNILAL